jgi:hypothetical protein
VPPLAVALSSSLSLELTKSRFDALATNGVQWGAQLALTAVLLYFPELEVELLRLGFRYNTDLTCDEMEVLWTVTRWTSESLSSRVPLSATRGPLDGAGEE